ncbi:fumarylacetoacetate hydrolase family protein [Paraburkholderia pallida]|uniref:FAA hydrolase family protein n=1 Tax=Paraburkholderia pallida TaxID=2547399 RepID=A0A4P7D3K9_9BURK|nr:fumarylacetoacetate hydrolase family protein [Paraburkholderia pallida]QBR01305.1 FAA hydrolase family protein [Paraburkholderia pallida]
MSRLIVRYGDNGVVHWGELIGAAPHSADDAVRLVPLAVQCATTAEFLAQPSGIGPADERQAVTIKAATLLSPVTSGAALICQGLNYVSHAQEAKHAERKSNLIFGKAGSSITGPYDDIVRPPEVELLDYEVEFALVIRKPIGAQDRITEENIGEYVAGVVLCNDVSARDVQFGESLLQWFRGKSYRTFCPVGPVMWLLEPDEVAAALERLEIRLHVNGELRQHASSQQLIWKPVETLNFVGTVLDMHPGDLLLTGTPGGVTTPVTARMVEIIQTHLLHDEIRRDELRVEMTRGRPFLRAGDVVTATLVETGEGRMLGGLSNTVVEAAAR